MDKKSCQKTPAPTTSAMTSVLKTIKENNLILPDDKIVLAVSGGPDSITMLDILNKFIKNKELGFKFEIVVAHINHMIRAEAKDDEMFVENFCKKENIEFFSKSIDVKKIANNSKIGVEEAGRNARYDFFDEVLEKTNANKIAIAHNKNDKIETMIMNVFRGSGISGLKGIEYVKNNKYIRPLLDCQRTDIEKYCEENSLNPRIDKTNFENIYIRNKIRNVVIPYIEKEFNPNIIDTMDRLSDLIKQEDEFINKLTEEKYREICILEDFGKIILDLKKFNKEEKVIKSRLILYTITRLKKSTKGIEKVHVEDIIKLCQNNIGNKFLTPNKNLKVLVKNHQIFFTSQD